MACVTMYSRGCHAAVSTRGGGTPGEAPDRVSLMEEVVPDAHQHEYGIAGAGGKRVRGGNTSGCKEAREEDGGRAAEEEHEAGGAKRPDAARDQRVPALVPRRAIKAGVAPVESIRLPNELLLWPAHRKPFQRLGCARHIQMMRLERICAVRTARHLEPQPASWMRIKVARHVIQHAADQPTIFRAAAEGLVARGAVLEPVGRARGEQRRTNEVLAHARELLARRRGWRHGGRFSLMSEGPSSRG